MSSLSPERIELIQKFTYEIRRLATANNLLASAIAQRVGLNASDLQCAQLLVRMGPLTAGQLAELSGLTTGAITGVVDRLEKAGWAQREADPNDRRRVIIVPMPEKTPRTAGLYDSYAQTLFELLSDYDDQELAMILEFISRFSSVTYQEASKMQSEAESAKKRKDADNPLA